MKRQVRWMPFACLVSVAILITSCRSPAPITTTTPKTTASVTQDRGTTTPPKAPQYGGTLTLIPLEDISVFDGIAVGQALGPAARLARDSYLEADWTRGPAGTGEFKWGPNLSPSPDTCMSALAESWRIPELGTVVFNVRRGVRWALDPRSEASRLVNGREVTADDWIATFNYCMSPRSGLRSFIPQLFGTATMAKTGPWEVTLKTPVDPLIGWAWLALGGLFPPEVIAKYGNMQDWHNFVHTGPFMISDYVQGSSATLTRNPNYWGKDPVGLGKGNQLPYIDTVKMLVTSDISTMVAALRTAKVDFFTGVPAEDTKETFIDVYPELKHAKYIGGYPIGVAMRLDKADLPYKDKRVRQALMLATDFESIRNEYYSGLADILGFPVTREAGRAYMPLEEMPEAAQALYRYDPDKAKALLAEAGYPDGFTARVAVWNGTDFPDLAAVLKAMWGKAGVNLILEPKELGAFSTIAYSRSYENMILGSFFLSSYPDCLNLGYFRGFSFGYVNDPVINAASEKIQRSVIVNMREADRLFRELTPYIVEQAYYVPLPIVYAYSLWWPWLKNYSGETPIQFAKYWWIDRDLKEEMTGRR